MEPKELIIIFELPGTTAGKRIGKKPLKLWPNE